MPSGSRTGDVRLIAAHAWDVGGALRAGCAAAFVARPGQPYDPLVERPDVVGADLREVTAGIVEAEGRNDPLQRYPPFRAPRSPGAFPEVLIFFYGTLKRGHANHDRYCQGAASVEDASVRGSLFDLPFGFPALVVPGPDVRALAQANPRATPSPRSA